MHRTDIDPIEAAMAEADRRNGEPDVLHPEEHPAGGQSAGTRGPAVDDIDPAEAAAAREAVAEAGDFDLERRPDAGRLPSDVDVQAERQD